MKKLVAGILSAALLTSAAAAASVDPEAVAMPVVQTAAVSDVQPTAGVSAELVKLPAYPATMEVLLNGAQVSPVGYNINGNNYYKLRDVAAILSGTESQFNVTWDADKRAINMISSKAYEAAGGELGAQPTAQQTATQTSEAMYLDGASVSLTAYNVQGNNYFKVVDIGAALGFQVGYDAQTRTVLINTPDPMPEPTPEPTPEPPSDSDDTNDTPDNDTPPQDNPSDEPQTPSEPVVDETACIDGKLRIWIDPGHGGSDAGNVSKAQLDFDDYWGVHHAAGDSIQEKDFNLAVSLMLKEMLEADGVEVRMTRTDDTTVTPNERKALFAAEGGQYDMIFSVHHNAYTTQTPTGAEILIQIAYENGGRGTEFGELLKQEYLDMGQSFRRFVYQHSGSDATKDYYFVLRSAKEGGALAFISEFCFMTNPEDQKLILSVDNLRAQAKAQYNAIMTYFETHAY